MSTQKLKFSHIKNDLKAIVMQNRGGQKVIERILLAYGFKSRQALCNHLGISQSTMANRYARNTFPADWVVICSIETGASIEWLVLGSDTAPSSEQYSEKHAVNGLCNEVYIPTIKFDNEKLMNFNRGGKATIERIVEAYGYKTRQALADHLGISKSTLATRYMRDIFPADWVLQCAIETGHSIEWISFGTGEMKNAKNKDTLTLVKKVLINGKLINDGSYLFDPCFLPSNLKNAFVVSTEDSELICEIGFKDVHDGKWLVNIDGENSFRMITRLPKGRVYISSQNHSFECSLTDIEFIAKVIISCLH